MSTFSSLQHSFKDAMEFNDEIPLESVHKLHDTEDGGAVFQINDVNEEEPEAERASDVDFYANLALEMEESELATLAAELMQEVKEDKEGREEWEKSTHLCLKYLGLKIEEYRDVPFMRACAQMDSTMLEAVIQSFATNWAELFPAAGPAKSGISGTPDDAIEDQGERVKLWMNYYLTKVDKGYYPDREQLLWYIIFFGSAFTKSYIDPITKMPISRMIKPMDFIVNPDATNILEASRLTHILYLTRREIKLREESGDFREGTLPNPSDNYGEDVSRITKAVRKIDGLNTEAKEKKSVYQYYEIHVDVDPNRIEKGKYRGEHGKNDKNAAQRPYIITICEQNKKLASIRRGWIENDLTYERDNYFTNYYYLRGFGLYGIGIAQILGSDAITLTTIARQTIDAATLKSFPGGVRKKGMRMETNDKAIGPSEWWELETGEQRIQDCIMPMPYAEPSQVLLDYRDAITQGAKGKAGVAEAAIPEGAIHVSEGTTLAVLDVANKVQSTVLRSLHFALSCELELLFKLFGRCLPDQPYPFSVPGRETAIMRQDFNDRVNIQPVSDPNVLTATHRILRNEVLLKIASQSPEIHDLREIYHRMYSSMNIPNIDKILPPQPQPESLDPTSENMLVLSGKQVVASFGQDHQAHRTIHNEFHVEQKNIQNLPAYMAMVTHEQEHKCLEIVEQHMPNIVFKLLSQQMPEIVNYPEFQGMDESQIMQLPEAQQIQMQIMQTPPIELLKMPEIQNYIAHMDAQELMEAKQQQAEQEANMPQPVDPSIAMMADTEQRREAAHLKAETDEQKVESEAFKAQLKYESEKAKIEAQEKMAEERNELDLAMAQMKSPHPIYPE